MALREIGRIEDALASSNDAVASDQNFAEAHANRGDILQDLQRPHEALDAYERALALTPDLVPALINRGSLLQSLGRSEDALASYERAIALVPNLAEAWLNRSKALHVLGRWEDALASCDRAIALQPDFPPALLARAVLLADREAIRRCPGRVLTARWRSTRHGREAQLERAAILHKAGDLVAALANCERANRGESELVCSVATARRDCCTSPPDSMTRWPASTARSRCNPISPTCTPCAARS